MRKPNIASTNITNFQDLAIGTNTCRGARRWTTGLVWFGGSETKKSAVLCFFLLITCRPCSSRGHCGPCLRMAMGRIMLKSTRVASLMVQWIGIRCQCRGKWVAPLIWEDHTCSGATKSVCHNYWDCALEPGATASEMTCLNYRNPCALKPPHQEKSSKWEACTPQGRVAPTDHSWRKPVCSSEDPVETKANK